VLKVRASTRRHNDASLTQDRCPTRYCMSGKRDLATKASDAAERREIGAMTCQGVLLLVDMFQDHRGTRCEGLKAWDRIELPGAAGKGTGL